MNQFQPEGASLLQLGHDSSQEPHPLALLTEYVLGLAASSDPDTMTFDDAMQAPD
jgi:hypothetical protein